MRDIVKDWQIENAFRDLFWSNPNLKDNEWLKYVYSSFREMEDRGERDPCFAEIFEDKKEKPKHKKSDEFTRLSLVDLDMTLRCYLKRR
jgi:hypothetical protein